MLEKRENLQDFVDHFEDFISSEKKTQYIVYPDTEVNYGTEEDCNVEWCKENNIPCFNIGRTAGCCVNASGSINIADIRPSNDGLWIDKVVLPDFVNYLNQRNIPATFDHNDVMINGLKVAAGASVNIGPKFEKTYTCLQFSIYQDEWVIENACLKPSIKKPGRLSNYEVSTQEVMDWLEQEFEKINTEYYDN